VRHPDQEVIGDFFIWLGVNGFPKRSIPMPDRIQGGWILFIYQQVDKQMLESWSPINEE
tara:strand:- start:40 stop:216 length:177 start_codon:yes stop_codon:yes gene_type:complete